MTHSAAYERLAQKYNPVIDSTPTAALKLRDLSEAYSILGDPVRRANYDNHRRSAARTTGAVLSTPSAKSGSSRWRWVSFIIVFLCLIGFSPSIFNSIRSQLNSIRYRVAATPLPLSPRQTVAYILKVSDLPLAMKIFVQQQVDATPDEVGKRESPEARDALARLGFQGGTITLYVGNVDARVQLIASYVYVFQDTNGAVQFFDLNESNFRSQYTSVQIQKAPPINGVDNVQVLRTQGKRVNDFGTRNVVVIFRKGNVIGHVTVGSDGEDESSYELALTYAKLIEQRIAADLVPSNVSIAPTASAVAFVVTRDVSTATRILPTTRPATNPPTRLPESTALPTQLPTRRPTERPLPPTATSTSTFIFPTSIAARQFQVCVSPNALVYDIVDMHVTGSINKGSWFTINGIEGEYFRGMGDAQKMDTWGLVRRTDFCDPDPEMKISCDTERYKGWRNGDGPYAPPCE